MLAKKMGRHVGSIGAACLLLIVAGCVQESNEQGEHVFTYEIWVPLCTLLGGIVAIPAGLALRRFSGRLGWGLMILGPISAIGFAPSLFMERTAVTDKGFTIRSGIWGLTAAESMQFDSIARIIVTAETSSTRRGGKNTSYYLLCVNKAGEKTKVSINNDVTQAAALVILTEAQGHNIPTEDATGGN